MKYFGNTVIITICMGTISDRELLVTYDTRTGTGKVTRRNGYTHFH